MPDSRANRLLAALPEAEWLTWSSRLERAVMPLGTVLYESGGHRFVHGGETTINRAVVQSASVGYRLNAQAMLGAFEHSSAVTSLLLRYTQALITQMTAAAQNLQRDGLIRYARGRIRVLDRPGLEARTCERYAVVKREYDRLLPAGQAA